MDNTVTLSGNLTRDPELKFSTSGTAVCGLGLAINTRKRGPDGGLEDGDPGFYNLTCFNDIAEHAAESLTKGQRVVVTGRLDFQTWETDDGDKRSAVKVIVDDIGPSLRWGTTVFAKAQKSDAAGAGTEEPF